MTGEELDADLIAEEICAKVRMIGAGSPLVDSNDTVAFEYGYVPIEDRFKRVISDVLASYGATREPKIETPNSGTTGS